MSISDRNYSSNRKQLRRVLETFVLLGRSVMMFGSCSSDIYQQELYKGVSIYTYEHAAAQFS